MSLVVPSFKNFKFAELQAAWDKVSVALFLNSSQNDDFYTSFFFYRLYHEKMIDEEIRYGMSEYKKSRSIFYQSLKQQQKTEVNDIQKQLNDLWEKVKSYFTDFEQFQQALALTDILDLEFIQQLGSYSAQAYQIYLRLPENLKQQFQNINKIFESQSQLGQQNSLDYFVNQIISKFEKQKLPSTTAYETVTLMSIMYFFSIAISEADESLLQICWELFSAYLEQESRKEYLLERGIDIAEFAKASNINVQNIQGLLPPPPPPQFQTQIFSQVPFIRYKPMLNLQGTGAQLQMQFIPQKRTEKTLKDIFSELRGYLKLDSVDDIDFAHADASNNLSEMIRILSKNAYQFMFPVKEGYNFDDVVNLMKKGMALVPQTYLVNSINGTQSQQLFENFLSFWNKKIERAGSVKEIFQQNDIQKKESRINKMEVLYNSWLKIRGQLKQEYLINFSDIIKQISRQQPSNTIHGGILEAIYRLSIEDQIYLDGNLLRSLIIPDATKDGFIGKKIDKKILMCGVFQGKLGIGSDIEGLNYLRSLAKDYNQKNWTLSERQTLLRQIELSTEKTVFLITKIPEFKFLLQVQKSHQPRKSKQKSIQELIQKMKNNHSQKGAVNQIANKAASNVYKMIKQAQSGTGDLKKMQYATQLLHDNQAVEDLTKYFNIPEMRDRQFYFYNKKLDPLSSQDKGGSTSKKKYKKQILQVLKKITLSYRRFKKQFEKDCQRCLGDVIRVGGDIWQQEEEIEEDTRQILKCLQEDVYIIDEEVYNNN